MAILLLLLLLSTTFVLRADLVASYHRWVVAAVNGTEMVGSTTVVATAAG